MSPARLVEIAFPAQPESLRQIRALVADVSQRAGCTPEVVEQLVLALDEACSNIIRHAYLGDPLGRILVSIDQEQQQLVFRLRDFAAGVDVSRIRPRPANPERPGGLGLKLIDSIMDHWAIEKPHDGQGNLLVMTKTIC